MQSKITSIVVLCLTFGVLLPSGYAEEPKSPIVLAQPQEELTAQDVFAYLWDQTVVTVSRREQKISEAPASIIVITAEDIKRTGALNVYELLRAVGGMEVAVLTQTSPALSMRGFNTAVVSRTMMLLLNGNPIYPDVTMAPLWTLTPFTLQEIERIEIVRGPGSALWGANAYSGVINIITKTPEKFPRHQISQSSGNTGTSYTNVIHSCKIKNIQYRFQYEHDQMHNVTLNSDDFAVKRNIYTADFKYKTTKQHELSAVFGYAHPKGTVVNSAFSMVDLAQYQQFLHLTFKTDANSWIKIRHKSGKSDNLRQGSPFRTSKPAPADEKSIGIELQTTKKFQHFGILTYGSEYKFVDAYFLGPRRTQGMGSIFAQDDFPLNKKLLVVLGARIDTHPQVKTTISPRISFMYKPVTNHILRITGATSYRRPSYVELYANTLVDISFPPFVIALTGDENIKAESIQSLEMSYTGQMTKRVKISTTFFRNILNNFIRLIPSDGKLVFVNRNKATQNGTELELEKVFTKSLKGFMNYAFNQTKDTSTGKLFEMSPKHKVNAGLGWMPVSGLYGNLVFNFVDDTGQTIGDIFRRVEAYRNWDLNLGYRFSKKLQGLEFGLNAQNLLNKTRLEHPAGDTFKRRIVATVSYSF